jgi:hypothetical protein
MSDNNVKEINIDSLTKEQEIELEKFKKKWKEIGLCTDPCDKGKAEKAALDVLITSGLPKPDRFVWTESPVDLCKTVIKETSEKNEMVEIETEKDGNITIDKKPFDRDIFYQNVCMGYNDADWLGFYDFFQKVLGLDLHEVDGLIELAKHCGWWIAVQYSPSKEYPNGEVVCYMSERFKSISLDDRFRLHNLNGPSMEFRDGRKLYHISGMPLTGYAQEAIENPLSLKISSIEEEKNIEIRRVMIDTYERCHGKGSFIIDSGAVEIHKDDWGTLYKKDMEDDEAIVMVKVVNSTREADGSFKDYFIRVPPTILTAKEAVAWTMNETQDTYSPEIET